MTITRYARILALSTAATLSGLVLVPPSASAQTLMDLLFRDRQRQAPPVEVMPEPAPVKRAAPPRVAGPQYYTYKTDPLVRVDFASIVPSRIQDGAEAVSPGIDTTSVGSTIESRIEEVLDDARAAEAPATAPQEPNGALETSPAQPDVAAPAVIEIPAIAAAPVAQPLTDAQISSLQSVELLAEKDAARALVEFYSVEPTLMWVADGKFNDKARKAVEGLAAAKLDALDPRDYAVALPGEGADEAALAAFEMELSARILRYARDASAGRVDPNRISGYHDFKAKIFDGVDVLRSARASENMADFFAAQHPQNAQYKALRDELARLRASAENDIVIEPKTLIKPGETSAEFPKILQLIERRADEAFRAEHGETLSRNLASETYSQELVPVIKAAQRLVGLGDDGVIGARTVQAFAGESKASSIEKVEVAMEQLRWLPSDLSDRYVFLNTPAYEAVYVEDGQEKLSMRTVVGRLDTQTYFFNDEISYVEFHPYWGMPRSILVNTYLTRVLNDPTYFDRNGYEVVGRNGQTVSSTSVDWASYGANIPFDVRQRPGPSNALGEMKIMFPNSHAIYMHDTPDKHLFSRDNRALSNGCIRLADPRAMAAAVLGWDRERVNKRLEGKHGRNNLDVKVPVYVAYFTAWPTQSGEVRYFNDVYSRDEKVRAAIEKIDALRVPGV